MDNAAAPSSAAPAPPPIRYLTAAEAKAIDEELMSDDGGWPLPALMELAGKSVADAIYDMYPPSRLNGERIIVLCGKGNNGGDGLVAARHLHYYGYRVSVVCPEQSNKEPHAGLRKQLRALDVMVNMGMPGTAGGIGLIVDAVFGFSFRPPLRPPYDYILKQLLDPSLFGTIPVVSVDVPLGWDVELGAPREEGALVLQPDMLVSLSAPKMCARRYEGMHYLGGRFIPARMNYKYKLNLPKFEGTDSFAILPPPPPLTEEDLAQEEAKLQQIAMEEERKKAEEAAKAEQQKEAANPLSSMNAALLGGAAPPAAALAGPMPGVWPDPDPDTQQAIKSSSQLALRIIGEKREGWSQELRNVVASRLVPLGWTSEYPPDRTDVSKVCFLAAKALLDKELDAMDMLSEGRSLAEGAFEEEGEVGAGKLLRGFALLYEKAGDPDSKRLILEQVDRVIAEKALPADLELPPARPVYTYADKWQVTLVEPSDMGEEEVDVVIRPKQKAQLLAKAWATGNGMEEEQVDNFDFIVPEKPKSWKTGKINLDDEIGLTGLMDGRKLLIVRKESASA